MDVAVFAANRGEGGGEKTADADVVVYAATWGCALVSIF